MHGPTCRSPSRRAKAAGATAIKIYADLPAPLVSAITAEAHRQHLMVWAHAAVFPASPRDVADAGVDVMSHVCMLGYQASTPDSRTYHNRAPVDKAALDKPNAALDALLADMKRRGTIMDATLYVYEVLDHMKNATPPAYCTLAIASKLLWARPITQALPSAPAPTPTATGTIRFPPSPTRWRCSSTPA